MYNNQDLFDFSGAVAIIPSAAIGSTVTSAWVRIINVDTITMALATTSTANGTWKIQVATDKNGSDVIDVPAANISPALPTGAASSASPVITIPSTRYKYLRVVFTVIGGAGNLSASFSSLTSRPAELSKTRALETAVWVITSSTSTHAGTPTFFYGDSYFDREIGGSIPMQDDGVTAEPTTYVAAVDSANAAITYTAVTTGAIAYVRRMGQLSVACIQARYAFTSGAGRVRARLTAKGL